MWRVSSARQQAVQALEYSTEHSNSIEEAAGRDGCKVPYYLCMHVFLHIISVSDNEELKHNSLMHEKKGLHRAGYTQVMAIPIKLT